MKSSTTAIDITVLAEQVEKAFANFAATLSLFTASQLNELATGKWTAGQVAQHIIKATAGIPDTQVQKATRVYDEQVENISALFLNMEIKMQAPDFIIPEERTYGVNEQLHELENNKTWLLRIISCKPMDELCMDVELPVFGFLTRYEWMQFIRFHIQRHHIQLKNILSTFKK